MFLPEMDGVEALSSTGAEYTANGGKPMAYHNLLEGVAGQVADPILPQQPSTGAGSGAVAADLSTAATRHLQLIGKDPAWAWFRTIRHGKGANRSRKGEDLYGFDAAALAADSAAGDALYLVIGEGSQATGKDAKGRPTGAVIDDDIEAMPALFVEWDSGEIADQLLAWQRLGLPEPTLMLTTGGKSVHAYWRLREPAKPAEWKSATTRLIAHCKSDASCKNPSRVMRLAGSAYINKATGTPTGTCAEIVHEAPAAIYSLEQILTCLPDPEPAAAPLPPPAPPAVRPITSADHPRTYEELERLVGSYPTIVANNDQRDEALRLVCGLTRCMELIGKGKTDAITLASRYHPQAADTFEGVERWQFDQFDAGSFINQCKAAGVDVTRHDLKRPSPATAASAAPQRQQQQPKPAKKREPKARKLSHTKAMACFERCVEIQAKRERNSLRRRARLLKAAADLGLSKYLNRQEIAQRVLEAKDNQHGHSFQVLTAADRAAMKKPVLRWLVPDLIPTNDLTIIGGRPKVGKTRLAIALAAAVLRGAPFLGSQTPATAAPVVLVTDDQSDADSAEMLEALQLWDHPRLFWSRHFRLTENDLDGLLATVKANPGALVVLDSLRSIGRSLQHGENDPEIGATLYDLKQAVIDAGGTLLLIHHCNKGEALVGTEALSGHNAIAGAANSVITLHYCPDANDRPDKDSTQRRMFCEGRSSSGCDVVIDRSGGGSFRLVSTFSEWRQQLAEARQQLQQEEGLTPTQQQLRERLEADPGQWFTRRQLVEELGLDWADGRGRDATRVRESLDKLVQLDLIEKENRGREMVFCASCGGQKQSSPSSPSSPSSQGKGSEGEDQGEAVLSFLSFQSEQGVSVPADAPAAPTHQPPAAEGEEGEAATSPCNPLAQLNGEEGEEGEALSVGSAQKKRARAQKPPKQIHITPIGSGADVMDDDDDPAWPPRPQREVA